MSNHLFHLIVEIPSSFLSLTKVQVALHQIFSDTPKERFNEQFYTKGVASFDHPKMNTYAFTALETRLKRMGVPYDLYIFPSPESEVYEFQYFRPNGLYFSGSTYKCMGNANQLLVPCEDLKGLLDLNPFELKRSLYQLLKNYRPYPPLNYWHLYPYQHLVHSDEAVLMPTECTSSTNHIDYCFRCGFLFRSDSSLRDLEDCDHTHSDILAYLVPIQKLPEFYHDLVSVTKTN